jgi:translation elongation factor EF-G
MVPLANMFGYVNQLRSIHPGPRQYSMQFSHYEKCRERGRRSEGKVWPD